jgi:hypothetical protein
MIKSLVTPSAFKGFSLVKKPNAKAVVQLHTLNFRQHAHALVALFVGSPMQLSARASEAFAVRAYK